MDRSLGPHARDEVPARLAALRERIAAAGGDPSRVTVVAVTKGFGVDAVRAAVGAGLVDVGENYAGELAAKMAATSGLGVRWHFLGHVQRNKVRRIAAGVHLWQGVDRPAAGEEIARRRPGAAVLVQVNLTGAPGRNGCRWEEAPALVEALAHLGLEVRGLMGVGPGGDPEAARPLFRRLAALAADLGLTEVSMGMSGDLEVAVQEGATMVRVGTALFGPRPEATPARR
jgi:pyridoxal phosphate enzyme (YggS family)